VSEESCKAEERDEATGPAVGRTSVSPGRG
jgi:hypothetical protein